MEGGKLFLIRKPYKTNKNISRLFYILMMIIFVWFIGIQILGPDEQFFDQSGHSIIYNGTFTWKKSDGTKQNISVPGRYKVPAKQTMIITTTLPDDYNENVIAIRSSLQDVRFYIDGKLRKEYNAKSLHRFGKNSASRYIFCNTSSADAGKELCLELTTYTSNYSGVVNTIYCGDQMQIWSYIFNHNFSGTVIGSFIFFASIVTILFSIALGIVYKTKFNMEYLGWCMVMGAVWMLGESKFRQILVPNASALGSLCFVMILLCPLPILFFADSLQKGLHHRFYVCLGSIAMINFAVCTILTAAGIADYIETMPVSHGILAITVATIFVHLFQYIRTEKNKADRLLLIGLLTAILCIAVEATSVYFVTLMSGLFVGAGMLILLFVNIVRAIKNVQDIELKRQQSEIRKNQEQNEKMSLQMIQTLSTTIEAKDAYTRGHSYRVAQYAALIAEELGWTPEEILNLKRATHLHDIGKIGIPDPFLNKPAQLTDDEYNLIKKHTVIGAEILKDITLIPHAAEIARSHHERYDGKGYPDGLAGTEIPIHARIVAVADCYDAMNSRRIYRNALPPEVVYEEFRKNRGTQFDPEITDIFLKLLNEKRLPQWDPSQEEADTYNLPDMQLTVSKFISDIMATIKSQEDAKSYDFLTGLPMRNLGERLTAEFMQTHDGCLVFLDMDNLKKINDLYGHKAGDRALKLLGGLLADYHEAAVACRLGGDEFLALCAGISRTEFDKRLQSLTESVCENGRLAASIGSEWSADVSNVNELIGRADKKMYEVKRRYYCDYIAPEADNK